MEYYERYIEKNIKQLLHNKTVLEIQGMRSVGKSTILEKIANKENYTYIKCTDLDFKRNFIQYPKSAFEEILKKHQKHNKSNCIIFDEAQVLEELPQLVKDLVDTNNNYSIILSGSRYIDRTGLAGTDPLVGRISARLKLYPLTNGEINSIPVEDTFIHQIILKKP